MWLRLTLRLAHKPLVVLLTLAIGARCAHVSHGQALPHGVVVEDVGKDSAGEKAGIRPGDVLLSWTRVTGQSTNPEEARGEIQSPFEFGEIEREQSPHGDLRLWGTRAGKSFSLVVPPGAWAITVRPALMEPLLAAYQRGKDLIGAKKIDEGLGAWRDLAAAANASDDWKLVAWLLLKAGDALATSRRWDEAFAQYRDARQAAEIRGDSTLAASILDAEATALERQNDLVKAESAYREAFLIREKIAPGTLGLAGSMTKLGTMALGRGELDRAEPLFKRAVAIHETLAPNSLSAAASLHGLGGVARGRGDSAVAEASYRSSLAIREKLLPDSLEVASSLNNLGVVLYDRGELAASEEFHRRALAIRERLAPDSLLIAASLNNLGIVAEQRGDLAGAEEFQSRGLAIRERLAPDSLGVAASLNNLGVVTSQRGDQVAAESLHQRALAIREKLAPHSLEVAVSLTNLGMVASHRGDLAVAQEFHTRALAIEETQAPDSLVVAQSLSNLGNVAIRRGDLVAADEFHRRALAIKQKRAPDSLFVAITLSSLGNVAQERNDLKSAEEFHTRALTIREKLAPASLVVARSLSNLGDVARERGDRLTARRLHERALSFRQKFAPGSTEEAESLHSLGLLAHEAAQSELAADFFRQAIGALEAQTVRLGGAEDVRSGFAAEYAEYYRDYIGLLVANHQVARAFDILERSRARSLLSMVAERDLLFAEDLPPAVARDRTLINADYDRTQDAIARLNPAKESAEIERLLTRLRELRDKREVIAQTIRKNSPRFASLHYPQPLDLAAAQRSLDAGTVLLAYCVTKEKTYLFVVQPAGRPLLRSSPPVSVFTLPIGDAALRERIGAFRELIQRGRESHEHATDSLRAAGRELFETLVNPARGLIAASSRVLISPDGPLHTLPFAALLPPSDQKRRLHRYFIEWKPLHIVASATVYAELKKNRRNTGGTPSSVVLAAFGDPAYLAALGKRAAMAIPEVRAMARRGHTFEPLPATRTEVEAISRLYAGRAATYLGHQATEERAKAIGRNVRYLHFASHGLLDERFPLNSALALTIPERPSEGQANGLLQAWEIFEQMRIDADLVTLSACETGLGKEMGGEGLIGLARAFQYAGARAVLASLWNVGDDSTAELMTRFYGHLKRGKAKDEALRAAQIDLIRRQRFSKVIAVAHPFHWAAFQLFGDWRSGR
jgi:CHAT domain-containing protein/Tfp pilus assembly protein PilF